MRRSMVVQLHRCVRAPLRLFSVSSVSRRGCGSMVECGLPKPETRVRFPSPAPSFCSANSQFSRPLSYECHTKPPGSAPFHWVFPAAIETVVHEVAIERYESYMKANPKARENYNKVRPGFIATYESLLYDRRTVLVAYLKSPWGVNS